MFFFSLCLSQYFLGCRRPILNSVEALRPSLFIIRRFVCFSLVCTVFRKKVIRLFLDILAPLAGTHCAHPRRGGQAKLAWLAGYISRWFARPKTVTHPNTIQLQWNTSGKCFDPSSAIIDEEQ